jgi:hypothetical protein
MMMAKIAMENINTPGRSINVDAAKYAAMRAAILAVLPKASPGITVAELKDAVLPRLPDALFPAGAKAGWWLKGVQLDLEAKRKIARDPASKPLRLRRLVWPLRRSMRR